MICDSTFSGLSYQSMARTDTSFQPSPSNTFFLPISRSEKVLSASRCSASSRIPSLYRSGCAGSVIPRSTRKEERPIPQTAFRPCFCRASFISRAIPPAPWSLRRSQVPAVESRRLPRSAEAAVPDTADASAWAAAPAAGAEADVPAAATVADAPAAAVAASAPASAASASAPAAPAAAVSGPSCSALS